MTRREMLKDLEYLVTEGELEYFETLSDEDLKRQYDDFFNKFEGYKSSEELEKEYWDKKFDEFRCPICPPNKGDNRKNWKRYGTHKPKYKNKRI